MASKGSAPLRHLPQAVLWRNEQRLLDVRIAETYFSRLRGLLGIQLAPDVALYISPCRSIHMWGMGHALDVIFVDHDGSILAVCEAKPWQIRSFRSADAVLECATGTARRLGLAPGQRLRLARIAASQPGERA